MRSKNVKNIALSALFAALTAAAMMIHLPLMSQGGYFHLGDSIIYLTASFLPLPFAALSAAVGGAMGDMLFGYFSWIPFTVIIKALIVLPFFIFKNSKKRTGFKILACVISGILSCTAYFFASRLIYGSFAAAAADILGNIVQAAGSAIIYILLSSVLKSSKFNLKG